MTIALPSPANDHPLKKILAIARQPAIDPTRPVDLVDELIAHLAASVAATRIDKLDGLPIVQMKGHTPPLAAVTVSAGGWTYTLTADEGRRAAVHISDTGKGGAAIDMMELCDKAEQMAAVVAGRH